MKKIVMKKIAMKKAILSGLVLISLAATSVYAEPRQGKHLRAGANLQGEFTRQVQQKPTANGIVRNTVTTNAQGETATRDMTLTRDKEAGTRTRTVEGTNFEGGSYSGQAVTQKTDDGYSRDASFTNAQGKTVSKSTDVVVDKEAGSVTKNVSVTRPNGEVTTTTKVTTKSRTESEPAGASE